MSLPLFFFLSLRFSGSVDGRSEQNLQVFDELMIPVILAVLIAYVSAPAALGLSIDLPRRGTSAATTSPTAR